MRAGYKVENMISESDSRIVVVNSEEVNILQNLGTSNLWLVLHLRILGAVGFWRIKRK